MPKGEGLGLSLGLAAGAALCWMLSQADTGTGWWAAACGIAAWVLYTAAASWSLIRRHKTSGRLGFSYLGVAALIFSIGVALFVLGLFALGRGLGGPFGPILLVIGVGTMVLGLARAGIGVERIWNGQPRKKADPRAVSPVHS